MRSLRVGEEQLAPGEGRWLTLGLEPVKREKTSENKKARALAVPVFALGGLEPGPRVAIFAAPRGQEAAAALAATRITTRYTAAHLRGSLTVVPALGLAAGIAGKASGDRDWRFPGDPVGDERARLAFRLFSALAVPADLVVLLTSPPRERRSALVGRVTKGDTWARSLAVEAGASAGAVAVLSTVPRPGTLAHAAGEISGHVVTWASFQGPHHLEADVSRLLAALDGLLAALGMHPGEQSGSEPTRVPAVHERVRWVRAPASGILASCVAPGLLVPAKAPVGEIVRLPKDGTGPKRALPVRAPGGRSRLVLESAGRELVRKGEKVALLVPAPARVNLGRKPTKTDAPRLPEVASAEPAVPLAAGWVEWVSLPELGLRRVRAKLDTGARTSALHVVKQTRVGGTDARPLLAFELPPARRATEPGVPRKRRKGARVEARVRDWLDVRDTSGRIERRPVIETSLVIGPLVRRIRVTLTNRGDMRFPFLLGRTALGPLVIVHAHQRNLLARRRAEKSTTARGES